MGNRHKDSFRSNLKKIISHLLKYKYQPDKRSNSWRSTLDEHRRRIADSFVERPSLKPLFMEVFNECYNKARKEAARETKLPIETFPSEPPFTPEEVLDLEYLPE